MISRIMIIDDDPHQLLMFKTMLERNSYVVTTYQNPEDALVAIHNEVPDLILLDLALPVMDGFVFYSLIRQFEQFESIPVLAISAQLSSNTKNRCHELGFSEFIPKPTTSQQLREKVTQYLK